MNWKGAGGDKGGGCGRKLWKRFEGEIKIRDTLTGTFQFDLFFCFFQTIKKSVFVVFSYFFLFFSLLLFYFILFYFTLNYSFILFFFFGMLKLTQLNWLYKTLYIICKPKNFYLLSVSLRFCEFSRTNSFFSLKRNSLSWTNCLSQLAGNKFFLVFKVFIRSLVKIETFTQTALEFLLEFLYTL